MDRDAEHLRLLSIFHYVVGGLCAAVACIFIIHIIFGLLIVNAPQVFGTHNGQPDGPPALFGWLIAVMGALAVTIGWLTGGLLACGGYFLSRRRHYTFCLVAAGVSCLIMPFGTI